ncbi:hypothetical protein Tdes44962_MAKER03806 [Teratosphaeria destructans]|uniref:Uncharacterized protein n=1 Tax=Teratosphaeria destructans TaxID=418781 RepID=A0A9W7SP32_9PEZI|nr:hypothetical protein Tdes44962_MAKER03806 [Teratosphaeria destructans]
MPSPRTSPAMRPQSPLSPGYKASAHFDTLQLPSPRTGQGRPGNSARRSQNHSLKLPQLPRFHPANFPSAHSSLQHTPDGVSPQPPVSPRAHQRVMSDAQRQLYAYQRDILSAARATSPSGAGKPTSPKLAPLGSPGPVTPLELEGEDGYLVAGARRSGQATPSDELVDRLIKEEARRRQRTDHGKDRA